jgi:hypothetical protein
MVLVPLMFFLESREISSASSLAEQELCIISRLDVVEIARVV